MKSFTRDLIIWIEQNLNRKILIESVAAKSGYSMWYLQRLFRSETGISLATYIRLRRLTESAILLKMTSTTVMCVAEYFGFANQQAFTRSFSRHFNDSPGRYREAEHWHFRGLLPSLLHSARVVPTPRIVWIHPPLLSGTTHKYQCPIYRLNDAGFHTAQREIGIKNASQFFQDSGPNCFAQIYEPTPCSESIQFCLTFSRNALGNLITPAAHDSMREKFLCFPFKGTSSELTQLQIQIYRHIMPHRPEARRKGQDFFITSEELNQNSRPSQICGDYYIPLMPYEH